MPTATIPKEEAAIREHIDRLAQAIRAKDVKALMPLYAPDMTVFDVMAPLQGKGRDAYRENFERGFTATQGPIAYEIRDLRIATGGEVGVYHHLGHVRSTRKSGGKADYWVRVTSSLEKTKGHWLITHEHCVAAGPHGDRAGRLRRRALISRAAAAGPWPRDP
jgi:uncharacterized protein (TIGR02246 family)